MIIILWQEISHNSSRTGMAYNITALALPLHQRFQPPPTSYNNATRQAMLGTKTSPMSMDLSNDSTGACYNPYQTTLTRTGRIHWIIPSFLWPSGDHAAYCIQNQKYVTSKYLISIWLYDYMFVWFYGFWKLCIDISTCCLGQIPDRSKINRSSSLQNHHHMIHGPWPYIDPMAFPKNSECPVYWETPWTVLQGASRVLISLGNHHCKTILQRWWLIILFKTYIRMYIYIYLRTIDLDICLQIVLLSLPVTVAKKGFTGIPQ